MHERSDKTCSLLSEKESFRGRCTGRRQRYTLDGKVYGSFIAFIEAAYRATIYEIMDEFYGRREMSSTDLHGYFAEVFGFSVDQRTICRVLEKSGVQARGYAARKALSWKQGKMDMALSKMRQVRKRSYLLGSRAEQTVRYLLRQGLLILDADWDVVIGDNLQHILDRFEVDIPIVLIDRQSRRACCIAIEVDSFFTHTAPERQDRDKRKTRALIDAGWHVLRICCDDFTNGSLVAEKMTDLMLKVKRIAEESFAKNSFPAGQPEE